MKNLAFWGGVGGVALWLLAANALGVPPDAIGPGMLVAIVAGAIAAVSLRRGMIGASSGFWHSVPGRWLIGRIAGTGVLLLLVMPVFYAVCFVTGLLLTALLAVAGPHAVLATFKYIGAVIDIATAIIVWKLRTPTKVFLGKSTRPVRRWYRSLHFGRGGSSSFASIWEEWANRWQPGMIFFGHSLHDRHWPVGIKDERMIVTVAGNGGGKGETAIINNALTYPGSMFINDTKGQNAAVTARARREMGQDTFVLAPFSEETAHLNPLTDIDPEAPDYVEQIKEIVEALVIMGEGKDRVWAEWSKIVIEGLIDFVIRYEGWPEDSENAEEEPDVDGCAGTADGSGIDGERQPPAA